jgi:SagB-type dehydrogenase family enzyme
MRIRLGVALCLGVVVLGIASSGTAQGLKPIKLPDPQTKGGMPLMEALSKRQTLREFSDEPLPVQMLSDMLWAAFGVNRPESGKRTAPSAMNLQEIDIYVALQDGLYLFRADKHVLEPVMDQDVRMHTGNQPFVAGAPVNLIFVADYSRMTRGSQAEKDFYSATDTGFISQNVYLYCASAGLATVVRGWVDRDKLAEVIGLRDDQKIILAQTVGYPAVAETQKESGKAGQ